MSFRPFRPLVLVAGLAAAPLTRPAFSEIDPALLAGLKARSIGPAGMSGRIAAVEGVVGDPNLFYLGTATGGVWKSEDGGLTGRPIFDDQPVHSIGAVAVNQQNPDVVWVGTGEGNIRNSVSHGNGVYKSIDAGRTWSYLGLPDSERIHRIRLHPTDPRVAYVAVMGRLWSDSSERGVYKTTDGGATWRRVLYVNEKTGSADLDMDPMNPDKLFAALYEFRRQPWFFESGGKGSGLYVTHDGGTSWKQLTPEDGLPEGKLGRIGVAVAPSDPDMVYAFIEDTGKNGIYRSTDGGVGISTDRGTTWRFVGNLPLAQFYHVAWTWTCPTTSTAGCRTTAPGAAQAVCGRGEVS